MEALKSSESLPAPPTTETLLTRPVAKSKLSSPAPPKMDAVLTSAPKVMLSLPPSAKYLLPDPEAAATVKESTPSPP